MRNRERHIGLSHPRPRFNTPVTLPAGPGPRITRMSAPDILFLCLAAGVLAYLLDQKFGRGRSRPEDPTKKSDS